MQVFRTVLRLISPIGEWWAEKRLWLEPLPANDAPWPTPDGDHILSADVAIRTESGYAMLTDGEDAILTLRLVRLGYIPNTETEIENGWTSQTVDRFGRDFDRALLAANLSNATGQATFYNIVSDVYRQQFSNVTSV